jgi:hypothetical protein
MYPIIIRPLLHEVYLVRGSVIYLFIIHSTSTRLQTPTSFCVQRTLFIISNMAVLLLLGCSAVAALVYIVLFVGRRGKNFPPGKSS